MKQPDLSQIDLIAHDMEATLAFYRALGLDIPESALWRTPTGLHHVDLTMPGGLTLHMDSPALTKAYNRGWSETGAGSPRNVLTFKVEARDDVDRIHEKLTALGHKSSQPPYDAFWGARYAILEDPDGNHIGVMSASDPARRGAPPNL